MSEIHPNSEERRALEIKQTIAIRDVYGEMLQELGRDHQDIVVLDADLSGSTRTK